MSHQEIPVPRQANMNMPTAQADNSVYKELGIMILSMKILTTQKSNHNQLWYLHYMTASAWAIQAADLLQPQRIETDFIFHGVDSNY